MVVPVEFLAADAPAMLDRYQLIGEIASGGMATVFLARLAGVGGFSRLVAIKRLHPHLAREREFVEMFLDEARLAAGIHHQNVVGIQEIGTSDGGYYLVMDYVEGVTLATLLGDLSASQRRLPIPAVLRVVIDTLYGLQAAHELVDEATGMPLAVVHRDCTPQNILVGIDGSSRLTDFGIARAASRIGSTRDGSMKGKLAYMAPEQTKGDALDSRADLFSVGVVLWEALSGRRLFRGTTEAETLRRLLVEPIPSLSDVAGIHPALSEACARALAREPDDRYPNAVAMIEGLEDAAREWGRAIGEEEPVAPVRAVAALMRDLYEADASEQREAVRRWVQAAPPATTSERELTMLAPNARPSLEGMLAPRMSTPGDASAPRAPAREEDTTTLFARTGTVPAVRLDTEKATTPGHAATSIEVARLTKATTSLGDGSLSSAVERTPVPTSHRRPSSLAPSGVTGAWRWVGFVAAAVVVVGIVVMLARPESGPMQGEQPLEVGGQRAHPASEPIPTTGLDPVPELSSEAAPTTSTEPVSDEPEREAPPSYANAPTARTRDVKGASMQGAKASVKRTMATGASPSSTPVVPAKPAAASPPPAAGSDDLANPYR